MPQPEIPLFKPATPEGWEGVKPHLYKAYLEVVAEMTVAETPHEEKGRQITVAHDLWVRLNNKMAQLESAPSKPKHQRLNRTP
jgi:hypothetical protein